jgi:hypothetical protein
LGFADQQFVVDPVVRWIEGVGESIIGWDRHVVWAGNAFKVLLTPGVIFDDRHNGTESSKIIATER